MAFLCAPANHLGLDEMFDNVKITVNLSIIYTKTVAAIFTASITDIANGVFNGDTLPLPPTTSHHLPAPTGLTATGL